MDIDELEKERKQILFKYGMIISSYFIIVILFILGSIYVFTANKTVVSIFYIITTLITLFICGNAGKHFEDKVKSTLMQDLLKSIVGHRGEIFWKNSYLNIDTRQDYICMQNNNNELNKENPDAIEDNIISIAEIVFNKHCEYDEVFYGIYNNVKFYNIEFNEVYNKNKKFIEGNVLQIPCEFQIEDKIVLEQVNLFTSCQWKFYARSKIKEVKFKLPLANKKYKIFTNDIKELDKILTDDFICFANSLDKNSSFVFQDNYMYIITEHNRDKFKMGSLFKKVDDEKQYEKCKKDLLDMLDIVEKAKNISWVTKSES